MSKGTQALVITTSILSFVGTTATLALAYLMSKKVDEKLQTFVTDYEAAKAKGDAYVTAAKKFAQEVQGI